MIPKIESASSEDIKIFQEEKLSELLAYLSENSAYYKRVFSEHKDLKKLVKNNHQNNHGLGNNFIIYLVILISFCITSIITSIIYSLKRRRL